MWQRDLDTGSGVGSGSGGGRAGLCGTQIDKAVPVHRRPVGQNQC